MYSSSGFLLVNYETPQELDHQQLNVCICYVQHTSCLRFTLGVTLLAHCQSSYI